MTESISQRIGDVGPGARIAQGENITWIEADEIPRALYQLPPDIGDFTDRSDALIQLEEAASRTIAGGPSTVLTIAGPAGVGKSALAVHLAHLVAKHFTDAQLYINLLGADRQPLEPTDALASLLTGLGVSRDVMPSLESERSALFRATLASKTVVVLIDNARSEEQVRPLRPGDGNSLVLLTSRVPLTGLEGSQLHQLGLFSPEKAVELLEAILGSTRVSNEPTQADELAKQCGYLPLALRIAAARLKGRPDWLIAKFVARLSDERKRLSELKSHDLDVRAAIALTYNDLAEHEATLFRRLSLIGGSDFGLGIASRLVDRTVSETATIIERLEELQLLEPAGDDRYRFHDLIRIFADERLAADQQTNETKQALERALVWYRDRTRTVNAVLTRPGASSEHYQIALGWAEVERRALGAIVQRAHAEGFWGYVVEIADTLVNFMSLRSHWADWEAMTLLEVDAASQLQDRKAEARALGDLGNVYREQGRLDDAVACHERDLEICRNIGDRFGESQALNNLGLVYREQGRMAEALKKLLQDLAICRELPYKRGEGQALANIGSLLLDAGELDSAIEYCIQSLSILQEVGDRKGEAITLTNLGVSYRQKGVLGEAVTAYAKSFDIRIETGDRRGQGVVLNNLGNVYSALELWNQATECYEENLKLRRELGDRRGIGIALNNLSGAYASQGEWERAIDLWLQSLEISRQFGDSKSQVMIHTNLGTAYTSLGMTEEAQIHWRQAEALLEAFKELDT